MQVKNPNTTITTDKDDPSNQMIEKVQQSVPNVLACSIKLDKLQSARSIFQVMQTVGLRWPGRSYS